MNDLQKEDRELSKDDLKAIGNALIGDNKKLSDPAIKILIELLRYKEPLLKSELDDAELMPFVRAQSFTEMLDLKHYQIVLDCFLRTKMARKRRRVKELLEAMNPNYKAEKPGFFKRLFGGGGD